MGNRRERRRWKRNESLSTRMHAAEYKALRFQQRMTELLDRDEGIQRLGRLMMVSDESREVAIAFMSPPRFDAKPDDIWGERPAELRIPMVRFAQSFALRPDVPPELVASMIASNVKTAILKHWQSQSLLETEKPG